MTKEEILNKAEEIKKRYADLYRPLEGVEKANKFIKDNLNEYYNSEFEDKLDVIFQDFKNKLVNLFHEYKSNN